MKTICFTGKLSKFTRDEARALAQDAGYNIETGVSQFLDVLVTADKNSKSLKIQKARKFGITIISEEEFLEKVGKELEDKHLKKKEERKEADVTWEKLPKKICRKIGVECTISNDHINNRNQKDYNVDSWDVTVHTRNSLNPIYHIAGNDQYSYVNLNLDYRNIENSNKESECKKTIADLFYVKYKVLLNQQSPNRIPKNIEKREREVLKDLPLLSEEEIKKILSGSPNYLKLKLEIIGWNMLEN